MTVFIILTYLLLLIYCINQISHTIEQENKQRIFKLLNNFTKTTISSFLTGIIICLITQSSSIVTILTISFVSAKILKLDKGLAIIIGSNIGTTLISLIITLDVGKLYFFFILIGVILYFLKKDFLSHLLIHLGLAFLCLSLLEKELLNLFNDDFVNNLILKSSNPITGVISGTIISFLIQSSAATIALTQKLYMNNLLTPILGISLMMGANIGTTISGLLFSISSSTDAKRLALSSMLFNILGVVLFIPLLYIYKERINDLNDTYLISLSHIYFNIITGIIGILFIKPLCFISKAIIT